MANTCHHSHLMAQDVCASCCHLLSQYGAAPVVLGVASFHLHPKTGGFGFEQWQIVNIKATEHQKSVFGHHVVKSGHIMKKYVAVDVGEHDIEFPFHPVQYRGITQQYRQIVHVVETWALWRALSALHSSMS